MRRSCIYPLNCDDSIRAPTHHRKRVPIVVQIPCPTDSKISRGEIQPCRPDRLALTATDDDLRHGKSAGRNGTEGSTSSSHPAGAISTQARDHRNQSSALLPMHPVPQVHNVAPGCTAGMDSWHAPDAGKHLRHRGGSLDHVPCRFPGIRKHQSRVRSSACPTCCSVVALTIPRP